MPDAGRPGSTDTPVTRHRTISVGRRLAGRRGEFEALGLLVGILGILLVAVVTVGSTPAVGR